MAGAGGDVEHRSIIGRAIEGGWHFGRRVAGKAPGGSSVSCSSRTRSPPAPSSRGAAAGFHPPQRPPSHLPAQHHDIGEFAHIGGRRMPYLTCVCRKMDGRKRIALMQLPVRSLLSSVSPRSVRGRPERMTRTEQTPLRRATGNGVRSVHRSIPVGELFLYSTGSAAYRLFGRRPMRRRGRFMLPASVSILAVDSPRQICAPDGGEGVLSIAGRVAPGWPPYHPDTLADALLP